MSPNGSVTAWLDLLRDGHQGAIDDLWRRYFGQLVRVARARLGQVPRAAADEEDVALSALDSFCRRAEQGQFPDVADRHGLWDVLVMITSRKACDLIEYQGRLGRDWTRVEPNGDTPEESPLARVLSREPDPAFVAEMAETCRRLLARLGDEQLRTIAQRKLEGFTSQEIADQIDVALATVERRLVLIRECWGQLETS
jgi:DNA-directed RNA polymerase specialized sigma24 family protein